MPSKHAVLSASASHRWLACPPSALLCAGAYDKPSEFAQQGTEAHSLCEYKLKRALGVEIENPTDNLLYYDEEMEQCAEDYAQYIMAQVARAKATCRDPIVLVEQHLDYSEWVPDGFGTGDCVIVADGTIRLVDFKYGLGVLVEAEHNSQLMCYALGALALFDIIYDVREIEMTIFQPRRANISTYRMSRAELLAWADDVLAPTAELAAKGEGEFCAGAHCQFCHVKATCRKRAEYNLTLAQYDFQMPNALRDEEIEIILGKADEFKNWVSDVQEYALQQALSGKVWQGYKVVEGRSNRRYTDEVAVINAVERAGYCPYEQKLLTVTNMTKLLGKERFNEVLGRYIEKPPGKPTLVPMSDKRPAMSNAVNDFNEKMEEKHHG